MPVNVNGKNLKCPKCQNTERISISRMDCDETFKF